MKKKVDSQQLHLLLVILCRASVRCWLNVSIFLPIELHLGSKIFHSTGLVKIRISYMNL